MAMIVPLLYAHVYWPLERESVAMLRMTAAQHHAAASSKLFGAASRAASVE